MYDWKMLARAIFQVFLITQRGMFPNSPHGPSASNMPPTQNASTLTQRGGPMKQSWPGGKGVPHFWKFGGHIAKRHNMVLTLVPVYIP